MPDAPLQKTGPILVRVKLAGPRAVLAVVMALDTGATITVLSLNAAGAIGYEPSKSRDNVELLTAGGIVLAPKLRLRSAACLGQRVSNLDVVCHDLPAGSPIAGLLGLNFLRHFSLLLDFPAGRIVLQRRRPRALPR